MRNKRVAIIAVSVLVVVLVAVCLMAAPTLMEAVRSIHTIPPH